MWRWPRARACMGYGSGKKDGCVGGYAKIGLYPMDGFCRWMYSPRFFGACAGREWNLSVGIKRNISLCRLFDVN